MSGERNLLDTSGPTYVSEGGNDPTPRGDLGPGTRIGRYQLTSRLGAGAMGEVWAATDPQLEREIAIKLVHPSLVRQPEASVRMVREARAMAKVSHRAVIAIHDAGDVEGQLFLAMELVRGKTLGALMRRRGREEVRDWRPWLAMVVEAGRGLAAAHAAGVLHRDFKPDNVLVDRHGRVCVGDFGLATLGGAPARPSRPGGGGTTADASLTMTGALLGTPAYMSLEQLRGETIDARADQFSFCVVAYEAIYGERPFEIASDEAHNIVALDEALAGGKIRRAPAGSDVPEELREILVRGLATSRDDRWPDLGRLLAALDIAIAHGPRPRGSRRWFAVAATGVVVALAVALAARALLAPRHPQEATHLGPIPLRAVLALSPGGRLAIGTDRVEVRDLATAKSWSIAASPPSRRAWIKTLELDGETSVRWTDNDDQTALLQWDYTRAPDAVSDPDPPSGTWLGTMADGELVQRPGADGVSVIALAAGKRTLRAWQLETPNLDMYAISPARRRFAYVSSDRFTGHIVVLDTVTGQTWRSDNLTDPTAIAWLGEDSLLYATASSPAIQEVALGPTALTPPRSIHDIQRGFVARILVAGRRLLFVAITPATRVRVIDREPLGVRDLEPSQVANELGWTADGDELTWNPNSHALERRTVNGIPTPLAAHLDVEPVNATLAGDLALIALRDTGGRKLVAMSLTTGAIAWQHAVGASFVARCARDLAAPCYVARRAAGPVERYELVALDPLTGQTSGQPIYVGPLEDFAVAGDGAHLLVADGTPVVRELDASGGVVAELSTELTRPRSVAYDPKGGVLIAGTGKFGSYEVGHHDGEHYAPITGAEGELLLMVRPSPSGDKVLTLGRALPSELWQLELPR